MVTILHTADKFSRGQQMRGFAGKEPPGEAGLANIELRGSRRKITRLDGIGERERDILTEGMSYMQGFGPGVFISIANGRSPQAERVVRRLTRRVRSDVAQQQKRAGMRVRHALTEFEALGRDGLPKFNAHIVAVFPSAAARDKAIESLNGSRAYGKFGEEVSVVAERVYDWNGLTRYLLKEASANARYRRTFRYIGGSIRLGELGGNRVIPSNDLRATLERRGVVAPYIKSYARRLPKAAEGFRAELEVQYRDSLFDALPVQAAPPRPKLKPVKRHKIEPVSLPLQYGPTAIDIVNAMRADMTCAEIGKLFGLSRTQLNNNSVNRFGMSRRAVRQVLEHAKAA